MSNDYRNSTVAGLDRGIRNNNPGNIKAGDGWQGSVGQDSGGFIVFADMSWGTRAIGQALINMINKGYDTIATLIPQWSATDQAAYVASVSASTTIDPATQLGTDTDTISSLIRAIVTQENGDQGTYVTDQDIADGMAKINAGLLTTVQAAAVELQTNPIPYLIGGAVVIGLIVYLTSSSKKT